MEGNHGLDKYSSEKSKSEYGITTGTGAAAATMAAFLVLKEEVKKVNLKTPLGKLEIDIEHSQKLTDNHGRAGVVKRPYNDPDVTCNLEIIADVWITHNQGIIIKGGEGVGTVTKPGLQIPAGKSAINPIPLDMIRNNLQRLLPPEKGAEVVISVPGGKELAAKTLNPRLGIKNGISILGTTGIARSMSLESYKKSFKCQMDVAVAEGYRELIFVPGNIGENIARRILNVEEDQIIQMGNFVGYMLSEAALAHVKRIILLGHAGKIVKIAAGIFNTEHHIADGRREIIAVHTALSGAPTNLVRTIFQANTTEEMINILKGENLQNKVFNSIAQTIKEKCRERYPGELEVVIVNMDGVILNSDHNIPIRN